MTAPKSPTGAATGHGPSPTGPPGGEPSAARRAGLVLTGERTLPDIPDERYWFARHLVAYQWAADVVRESGAGEVASVLDAGCGEGYGMPLLVAAGAGRVVGADLDATVVAHARTVYADRDPRIEVVTAELMRLPLGDDDVDLTVSFQVIEHLHDIPGYLASLRRVTRRGGRILIATPNRLTFTPGSDVPVNPFHTREFTAEELDEELARAGLEVEALLGVHHGRRLATFEASRGATMPELVGAEAWDDVLRQVVHETGVGDFVVTDRHLDVGLDLFARCRVA